MYILIQIKFLALLRIVYDEEKILTIWICDAFIIPEDMCGTPKAIL